MVNPVPGYEVNLHRRVAQQYAVAGSEVPGFGGAVQGHRLYHGDRFCHPRDVYVPHHKQLVCPGGGFEEGL
jgi:hypothetical protein